jgi:hypothetical protein
VIFGLTIATILTLVVVPVAYTLFTPGGGEGAPEDTRAREALPVTGPETAREGA